MKVVDGHRTGLLKRTCPNQLKVLFPPPMEHRSPDHSIGSVRTLVPEARGHDVAKRVISLDLLDPCTSRPLT